MSKIGRTPIQLKEGITVTVNGQSVKVQGSKGEMNFAVPLGINVEVGENTIVVKQQKENDAVTRPFFGLTRAMLANMVLGVESGFEKRLELQGVGYRAQVQGEDLVLNVGFSHQVKIKPLLGIKFAVSENVISVTGMDKILVGDAAARIRAVRPPEPYKGKGIRYVGEQVRRKAGKAAKAVGGK